MIHLVAGEQKKEDCEGSEIARFVRMSMNALMAREVLILYSWSGTSRLNKSGTKEPKESYQALKGFCSVLQSKFFSFNVCSLVFDNLLRL